MLSGAGFQAPAVVADLDDVAVMGEGGLAGLVVE